MNVTEVNPDGFVRNGLSQAELSEIAFIAAYQRSVAPNFELRYDWGRLGEMAVRLASKLEKYYKAHPELRPGGALEEEA